MSSPNKAPSVRTALYSEDGSEILLHVNLPPFTAPPAVIFYRNNFFHLQGGQYIRCFGYISND